MKTKTKKGKENQKGQKKRIDSLIVYLVVTPVFLSCCCSRLLLRDY